MGFILLIVTDVSVCARAHECVLIQKIRGIIVRNDYPLLRKGKGRNLETAKHSQFPAPAFLTPSSEMMGASQLFGQKDSALHQK